MLKGYRSVPVVVGAVFAFLGLIYSPSASAAVAPGMELLGRTSLGKVFHDSDIIDLGQCGTPQNSPVRSVQIEVRFASVEVHEVVLQFGDGTEQHLGVREYFNPGASSRVIDLNGDRRCVRRIFVTGRTLEIFAPQAVVAIYASRFYGGNGGHDDHDRDDHDRGHHGDHDRDYDDDFHGHRFLGATYLNGHHDHDRIPLGNCRHRPAGGMFGRDVVRTLQFRVTENDAQIDHILVVFGNGQAQEIDVRRFFEEGTYSAVKDLEGERRCIQEILISGHTVQSRRNGFQEARFEIFALD